MMCMTMKNSQVICSRRLIVVITVLFTIALLLAGCDTSANGSGKDGKTDVTEVNILKMCDEMGIGRQFAKELYAQLSDSGLKGEITYIAVWTNSSGEDYYRIRTYDQKREVYLSGEAVVRLTDGDVVYYDISPDTAPDTGHIIDGETDETSGTAADTAGTQKIEVILNKRSKKYHYPGCRSIADISDGNMETRIVSDISELIDEGYSPCGICAKD